jgi:hypothetical protein
MKMHTLADIPEKYYREIGDIVALTNSHLVSVDPKSKGMRRFLRRENLRNWYSTPQAPERAIEALTWALDHPDIPYPKIVDSEFSNQACLRLFRVFVDHLKHIHDEGPDMVHYDKDEPTNFIPADQWKPE